MKTGVIKDDGVNLSFWCKEDKACLLVHSDRYDAEVSLKPVSNRVRFYRQCEEMARERDLMVERDETIERILPPTYDQWERVYGVLNKASRRDYEPRKKTEVWYVHPKFPAVYALINEGEDAFIFVYDIHLFKFKSGPISELREVVESTLRIVRIRSYL